MGNTYVVEPVRTGNSQLLNLRTETDSVSETSCVLFVFVGTPSDGEADPSGCAV